MAPRTAKAKKTPSTKAVQNGAPKKGNAKTVEEPEIDAEMADEVPVIEKNDKKTKKSRKAEGDNNGLEETNGVNAQPPKKGKKNKTGDSASAQKHASNSDDAEGDTSNPNDIEEQIESNGHTEEAPAKGKKTTKKEVATSKSKTDSKTSTRGKKNAKQNVENEVTEKDEAIEEKSKTGGKGRTRKVPQKANKEEAEPEEKNESGEEEIKTETSKGKKRGQTKAKKEKTPESESDVLEEENDMPVEEPKKKETKGKKNQGKKAKLAENEDEGEEKQEPATKKRKVTKKDKKDEVKVEEPTEEAAPEVKPAKGKRGPKKAEPVAEDDAQATGDAAGKRRRKADEKVSAEDAKKKAPPKNKSTTDYESIDFSNSSKNAQGKEWNLKIASWNVDGIRAWMSKGGLDYIKYEKPDILCLQETKCAKDKLPDEIANLPGYHAYWQGSDKDGYAGVGIYTTKLAMNVQYGLQNEELDNEGRIITAEYEQFYLICTYVPNAGRKLVTLPKRLHWNDEFRKHVKALNEKKPVIICGDMNVAHNEIDLSNPKSNKKNAGFTEEERAGMTDLLGDGFVDTYRRLHPDRTGAYTFWTYMMNSRAKNVGWRLDYFLVSERLLPALCDNVIRSAVYGSDHCPIALYLHITSADKPKE